ncbi:MAG: YeeE/YedE family protein [Actinomycetota bacterium]|nr:YeeE/YedE family protein [Actinomycetota bacterium]
MVIAVLAGSVAGIGMGYVLHRGQLCFHAMFAGAWNGRFLLLRGWALAVGVGAVGLALVYLTPIGEDLSTGLPLRPVANIVGGLLFGCGMAVAQSCVSGLFYKFGAGMAGAAVGILGWMGGEIAVRDVRLPGPTLLPGGDAGTIPGILGLPRLVVALLVLAIVAGTLWRWRARAEQRAPWQWNWLVLGVGLGIVLVVGWILAGIGGVDFGPSTVGASAGVVAGDPNWWLVAFLMGIVLGGAVAARQTGAFVLRGESKVRYLRLLLGGFLLGVGGWIAGGCNLGHGLSGMAQLNVASILVVICMALGVRLAYAVIGRSGAAPRASAEPSGDTSARTG